MDPKVRDILLETSHVQEAPVEMFRLDDVPARVRHSRLEIGRYRSHAHIGGLTDGNAPPNRAANERGGIREMVISTLSSVQSRRTAELAECHDHSMIQPALAGLAVLPAVQHLHHSSNQVPTSLLTRSLNLRPDIAAVGIKPTRNVD